MISPQGEYSSLKRRKPLTISRIHNDIQPANILVFPHTENSTPQGKTRFDVRFKLADFGLAECRRVSMPGENFPVQNEGSRMYSECCRPVLMFNQRRLTVSLLRCPRMLPQLQSPIGGQASGNNQGRCVGSWGCPQRCSYVVHCWRARP